MGFFDLFKKKEIKPAIIKKDLVWINERGKLLGCIDLLQQRRNVALVAWFPDTRSRWLTLLNEENFFHDIWLVRETNPIQLANKQLIMLEHYPLKDKEEAFLSSFSNQEILVLNSLDEPLLELFGGGRIVNLMERMGLQENDMVEHSLITKSLVRAQEKLTQKVTLESPAQSMKEWFEKNLR